MGKKRGKKQAKKQGFIPPLTACHPPPLYVKLTVAQIKAAKPRANTYRLADGAGLVLSIHPHGGKYWQFRYGVLSNVLKELKICPSHFIVRSNLLRRFFGVE